MSERDLPTASSASVPAQKRWLRWLGVALILLLVWAGAARWLASRSAAQASAAAAQTSAAPLVELAASDISTARMQTLAQGLPISGSLKAVNSATIKARVAGELQGLTLREGDTVQAGQVVARIDSTESRARLKAAQDQADAAKAQVDIAKRQFANNQALVDQGFISKTALDTSQANLNAAQATYQAAIANADVANKSLQDTVLRSPISGVVALRSAQPGERVGVDARVLDVMDLRQLELEAAVSAADSVQVQVGQRASLRIEGNASTGDARQINATVVRINPNAQAGSRSVLVYLRIDEPAGLRAGLFAQGSLGTVSVQALAVPLASVRTDKPEPYVQLVQNDQVAHQTVGLGLRGEVQTANTSPGNPGGITMVAVTGLAENARVIGPSVGLLQAGTRVKFTAASPAPAATAASASR
ncbi:MAG: efflux RND transporter periplasmic adaptor subunit [Burkholderiales bacterium]